MKKVYQFFNNKNIIEISILKLKLVNSVCITYIIFKIKVKFNDANI